MPEQQHPEWLQRAIDHHHENEARKARGEQPLPFPPEHFKAFIEGSRGLTPLQREQILAGVGFAP